MFVKTFTGFESETLDEAINKFFESWNNDAVYNYTLIDIKLCYHEHWYVAMVVYNKQNYNLSYPHYTF